MDKKHARLLDMISPINKVNSCTGTQKNIKILVNTITVTLGLQ